MGPAEAFAPPDRLAHFNASDGESARAQLLACCSSAAWAQGVLAGRPYACVDDVLAAADAVLAGLGEPDVDDALAGHPRIGERLAASAAAHGPGHSEREQAGVDPSDGAVLQALADGNRVYEERFGHVYLVFATGKSAPQMLDILRERLGNDPATERRVLRAELAKINRLRLSRMFEVSPA